MFFKIKKPVAAFLLLTFTVETFFPSVTYALTSGPAQPEMQKFTPAGASDLVDLFTGDFKYNIPLLDVGGYPVNLSYQSESGVEDEASWVGMGWSLNPGVMNRDMRGLPDDFSGDKGAKSDLVTKQYSKKEFKKIGASGVLKFTTFAKEFGKASIKLDVYKDNYYGIGADVGASLGFSLAMNKNTPLTAGLRLDLNSGTREGASISPTLSLSRDNDIRKDRFGGNLSGGFTYNSRAGLQELSLSASVSRMKKGKESTYDMNAAKYFGASYTPTFNTNTVNTGFTFNFDVGPAVFGAYGGYGGSGYVYKEKILDPVVSAPAFGYLNYVNGRKNMGALLDFNREKDGVFLPSAPAIPVPIATQDFFVATSQVGSKQYRAYYNGNYVVFDKAHSNKTDNIKGGVTVGTGWNFQTGARLDFTVGSASTQKWIDGNSYLSKAEAPFDQSTKPDEEISYLKAVGEQTLTDQNYLNQVKGDETIKVAINDKNNRSSLSRTFTQFNSRTIQREPIQSQYIKRLQREKRTNSISYLTASQAWWYGLDKKINYWDGTQFQNRLRIDLIHKPHHISEITTVDNEGTRMVYGIPVYNTTQEEATFSIAPPATADLEKARRTGIIEYVPGSDDSKSNNHGRDNLFSKEIMPGYATSFLLTGILSPDYVDRTGDGITDDDAGSAVKLSYSKIAYGNKLYYKWRTPYFPDFNPDPNSRRHYANFNEGFLSDGKDDRASYVYGEKEIWYLHSIESKTMIAIFKTSDREDALGVTGNAGDKNADWKLKKLDEISLYSKAEWTNWIKNGSPNDNLPVPIKVVHFEYDYSLYPGVLNNSGNCVDKDGNPDCSPDKNVNLAKGKLTLRKVYFTFGRNQRGQTNPYEFNYDMRLIKDAQSGLPANPNPEEANDQYTQRQQDRWGTYKQSWYNNLRGNSTTDGKLNNSEFPYALQENPVNTTINNRLLADRFASKWQLIEIVTPTSSKINIEYESDDYAFVQNKKAMQMCMVVGVPGTDPTKGLMKADDLLVDLPYSFPNYNSLDVQEEFRHRFLDGQDNVFFKILTNVDGGDKYEYVYGYAGIDKSNCKLINEHTASIHLNKINGWNPISKAAWQMVKTDLPQYAYDYYDNSGDNDGIAAIKSILQSIVNIRELFVSYDDVASGRFMANRIDVTKSMIRLNNPTGHKLGGGSRVKSVIIYDEWNEMAGGSSKTAHYGQVYNYTTTNEDGETISSGVASYEPAIGNEENPFHEPINYVEKVHWSSDQYHFIEKPFCETYFPAPSVGYSKVTVTSVGDDTPVGGAIVPHTGYIDYEFYTARDFPTQVDYLTLDKSTYEEPLALKLFSSTSLKRLSTSQGFKVELNDMHGKEKATRVYNNGGDLISSTEYFYNVDDQQAEVKNLKNEVDVLDKSGIIKQASLIGSDLDFVTDVRESRNESIGTSIGGYAGYFLVPFYLTPLPFFFGGINFNASYVKDAFNSISTVKVIHKYGLLKKVRVTQNGSTIETENLLWDGETGNVVLSKIQNEYNDYTYALHYPAYMAKDFEGMGSAYKNISAVFDLSTNANGVINISSIPSTDYAKYLFPGDELVGNYLKGWVIKAPDQSFRLIDQNGNFISTAGRFIVLRSGRRNMTSASAGSIVLMNNPIVTIGGVQQLSLGVDQRILDAKSVIYTDEWGVPVNDNLTFIQDNSCSQVNEDCLRSFLLTAISRIDAHNLFYTRRGIFTQSSDNLTADDIMSPFVGNSGCVESFFGGQPASRFGYAMRQLHIAPSNGRTNFILQVGDIADLGNFQIVFDEVSSEFNTLVNQSISEDQMYSQLTAPANGSAAYCVIKQSDCNYILRKATPISNPGPLPTPGESLKSSNVPLVCDPNPSPDLNYVTLISFHIIPPPKSQTTCIDPVNQITNPYFTGVLGNWRPKRNYVFTVSRQQRPGLPNQLGGTNIRNSGYYNEFSRFWNFTNDGLQMNSTTSLPLNNRWVWSNQSVYYDQKGNEVENVDALNMKNNDDPLSRDNRFGAALFGYRESVATAVAANARHNEIMFDGFEDYDFDLQNGLQEACPAKRHFDWGLTKQGTNWCAAGSTACITSSFAHTGKFSLNVNGTLSLTRPVGSPTPPSPGQNGLTYLSFDQQGRYLLTSNEQAKGFAPVYDPGLTAQGQKKYIVSMWVNDGHPNTNKILGLTLSIDGQSPDLTNMTVPVVEGWKRLEWSFTPSSTSNPIVITGANIFIDDVRMFPINGQLNSFVYDNRSMRLMAQLDENNFATFYEYDDEGTPIRVKKETERGIMTLKESRQSFRKR